MTSPLTNTTKQLIIIDSQVIDWQSLVGNISPDSTVIILDPTRDGISQIADAVANYSNLDAIHIISHGSSGSLSIGSSIINNNNIDNYASHLVNIGSTLTANGDILLYACNVAQGDSGIEFINNLAFFTGANIAASANLIGSAAQGGNWILEQQVGVIDAYLPIADSVIANYAHTLNNSVPVIGVSNPVSNISDTGTTSPFLGITITDAVTTQIQTVTVQLNSPLQGSLSTSLPVPVGSGYDAASGIFTLIGLTAAQAQTIIQSLVFTPRANHVPVGSIDTTTFTITVDDGSGSQAVNSQFQVNAISVNDPPVLSVGVAGQAINDNATVSPFLAFTIRDPDVGQIETLTITLDNPTKGTLSSLTSVGSYNNATGVYSFTGTVAQAQNAIRNLVFTPTASHVAVGTTETTTFTVSANDGFATTTDSSTTVVSTAVNHVPVLSGAVANQAVNDNATLSPFLNFSIIDPDVGQIQTVTVTLDDPTKGTLSSTSGGTFAAGVYSFSGTVAQAQTAIRNLIFTPTANHVPVGTTETTTFTVSVNDGIATVTNATTSVISTSINDTPVLGGALANQAVNDNASLSPFAHFVITDPDVGQIQTVTVTLDNAAKGVLSNVGTGKYDATTGVYSFSGTAAQAQAAIQALVFTPTASHVAVGSSETTTFSVSVNDGVAPAVINATTSVIATAVNVPPVLGGATAVTTINDAGSNSTATPFANFTISDPNIGQIQTLTVTLDNAAKGALASSLIPPVGSYNAATGVYSFTGTAAQAQAAIESLVFTPTANRVAVGTTETTTFTVGVNDGIAATITNSTTTVVSTSINDIPVLGGSVASQAVNDNSSLSPFTHFTITDPDVGQIQTLTVTLDVAAKGALSNLSGGTYNAITGIYSYTGTVAQIQAAIRGLVFTPTANHVAVNTTETTTFTVNVNDGVAATVTDNGTTVIATSINDAPVLAGAVANQAVNDNASLSPFKNFTITDPDFGQIQTVHVTLDNATKGVLSNLGTGSYDIATGVYSFTGTAAQAQTAIQALVFTPTANHVAVGTTETTTFTISVNDGVATTVTNNATTVVSTSINDAPVLGGAVTGQAILDNASISPFLTFTITDPDVGQNQKITVTLDTANKGVLSNLGAGTYNATTGVYSFSGTAAQAQAAIRALVFTPTANHVALGNSETTQFTVGVNDGVAATVTDNTTTVITTPVHFAPVLILPQTVTYTDTQFVDNYITQPNTHETGTLVVSNANLGAVLAYGIVGGTNNGDGTISKSDLYGSLTVNTTTGAYSYIPNSAAIEPLGGGNGASVTDSSIKVIVSDGTLSSPQQNFSVTITQQGNTETNGNDIFTGASLGSVDHWAGLNGNDTYFVDNTADTITELPNGGYDVVYSTATSYTLSANIEALVLLTGAVNGTGNDQGDIIVGNTAANLLIGGAGNDTLDGGVSDNYNPGIIDTLNGGLGNDTFRVQGFYGQGTYDGGAGSDWIDFSQPDAYTNGRRVTEGAGVNVHLDTGTAYTYAFNAINSIWTDPAGTISITAHSIENVRGTSQSDTIIGDINDNILDGGASDVYNANLQDFVYGGDGNDTIQQQGFYGHNLYYGGNGSDWIDFSQSDTYTANLRSTGGIGVVINLSSNIANSYYVSASSFTWTDNQGVSVLNSIENARGTSQNDVLYGDNFANVLEGGAGNDILYGADGADTYIGGLGADTLYLNKTTPATDTVRIAAGDSLATAGGYDTVYSFNLYKGVVGSTGIDQLNLATTNIATDAAAVDGTNAGVIMSHSITSGLITFGGTNNYTAPLAITAANLPDVLSYLQANITGNNTVAFVDSSNNTYVYQDGGSPAADTLVELVGASAKGVSTTAFVDHAVWIV